MSELISPDRLIVLDHWFRALPKQRDFLLSDAKESVYAGGFGSGKTLSGGMKGLLCSLEYPGTQGMVCRQTAQSLKDTTQRILLDGDDKPPVIPPSLVRERLAGDNKVVLVNGSEILFRSWQDWNPEKLRSYNLGWLYFDELTETTEKLWLELCGRLRHPAGPRIAWGTTNPNGHDWVWRRFHPDSGQAVGPLFHAPTEENYTLAPDYITHLRSMPLEWQKRFVDASFETAAGMIWPEWSRHVHVYPHTVELPYQWKRFESLDHGRRNPTCVLWWAIDPDSNLWVQDEYYSPGLVSQHAAAIKVTRGRIGWTYHAISADPNCFVHGPDGRSVTDLYRDEGVPLVHAAANVAAGILRVSEFLTRTRGVPFPEPHPLAGQLGPDGLGAPRLFVSDGCQNLIREIADYRWKDLSPTQEKDRDQPEEPRKKDDHACDALRYGCMARPSPLSVPQRAPDERTRAASRGLADQTF